MPECQHCGAAVTQQYVRVNAPDGQDTVLCCPFCPDRSRGHGAGRTGPSAYVDDSWREERTRADGGRA